MDRLRLAAASFRSDAETDRDLSVESRMLKAAPTEGGEREDGRERGERERERERERRGERVRHDRPTQFTPKGHRALPPQDAMEGRTEI